MLKKLGLVAVGATAGVLAMAPAALADGSDGNSETCRSEPASNGSTTSFGECSSTGKNNGQDNTFTLNGQQVAFPSLLG